MSRKGTCPNNMRVEITKSRHSQSVDRLRNRGSPNVLLLYIYILRMNRTDLFAPFVLMSSENSIYSENDNIVRNKTIISKT